MVCSSKAETDQIKIYNDVCPPCPFHPSFLDYSCMRVPLILDTVSMKWHFPLINVLYVSENIQVYALVSMQKKKARGRKSSSESWPKPISDGPHLSALLILSGMVGPKCSAFKTLKNLDSCIILQTCKECTETLWYLTSLQGHVQDVWPVQRSVVFCDWLKRGLSQNDAVKDSGMQDMFDVSLGSL